MNILAIETSCDETAFAVVEATGDLTDPKITVTQSMIVSQIDVHRPWGGVVPNLAKREHIKNLPEMYQGLELSDDLSEIDLIAVTVGPGLAPALWQGIEFAKDLAEKYEKPIIGVNHLEGHAYSILLDTEASIRFPLVGLSVSGGHTNIIHARALADLALLGETRDDAAGEAFDKGAKMLGLPYPGGPEIEVRAQKGDEKAVDFPRPMIGTDDLDFSFSGLKTALRYKIEEEGELTEARINDLAASYQRAIIDVLVAKLGKAAEKYDAASIFLVGGVSANKAVQTACKKLAEENGMDCHIPKGAYNTDNAAMIAAAGYINHLQGKSHPIEAIPRLTI